jgi:hypothetical protein
MLATICKLHPHCSVHNLLRCINFTYLLAIILNVGLGLVRTFSLLFVSISLGLLGASALLLKWNPEH